MNPQVVQEAQAAPEPVVKKVAPVKKAVEDKVEIINGRIHFRSGAKKFLTSKKVQKYLKHIAAEWKKNPKKKIYITGHTDSSGTKRANYRLGLVRSKSSRNALVSFGVNPRAIKIKSMGESKPLSSNRTRKGRFYNRRVEIQLK